jgi:hypothetical protein
LARLAINVIARNGRESVAEYATQQNAAKPKLFCPTGLRLPFFKDTVALAPGLRHI